jgi:hypothetical protein
LISRFMASRAAGFSAMKRGLTLCLAVCWPLVLSGCRDTPRVAQAGPPALSVSPLPLTLPDAWLGSSTTAELTLTNTGGSTADLDLATAPPFSLRVASLRLTQGDAVSVTVHFTPQVVGPVTGEVVVGTLKVPLSAVGLEVPVCHSSSVCQVASFDFESAQCAQVANADTTACSTKCIVGACTGGACVGALKACDDGNACTIDACDEERGCSHLPLECPVPSGRCKAPRCDAATGCGEEPVADGTLCGRDDCLATSAEVCIGGQCVTRPRPDTGRCANRWVPAYLGRRYGHAMAYDAARKRVVLFGGFSNAPYGDTWEWDGATWSFKTPLSSPDARFEHQMTYDVARQRVVLFGGIGAGGVRLDDTWAWDGLTWTRARASASPPARGLHSLAYDAMRQRVVLFGGTGPGGIGLDDTWEWDSATWTQRTSPSSSPSSQMQAQAMAYDLARQRVVLFTQGADLDLGRRLLESTASTRVSFVRKHL